VASHPASVQTQPRASESIGGAFWMFAAIAVGFTAAVVGFFALLMWLDARDARDSTPAVATAHAHDAAPAAGTDAHAHATAAGFESYAGAAPADAEDLAAAHKPYPAEMPALQAGPLAKFNLALTDRTV
jgi:hypothetical protein